MNKVACRLVALVLGVVLVPACYSSSNKTYTPPASSPGAPGAPGAFNMIAPANGTMNVSTMTSYSWAGANGATSYTLQVALDVGFTNMVVNQSGIMATIFKPASPLASGTVYWWRVIAVNSSGSTMAANAPFSFTTSL